MATEAIMNGYYRPEVEVKPGEKMYADFSCCIGGYLPVLKYFCLPPCSPSCLRTLRTMSKAKSRVPVKVEDARKKQVEEGLSKRDFFDKYGFVLFEHPTKMAAEDWLKHSSVAGVERKPEPGEASPVREIYTKELEPLVRELLPNVADISWPFGALRRGPGGPNTSYGLGIHQDYGLYPADLDNTYDKRLGSFEQFMERLKDPSTAGYMVLNFWRPVLPMKGPVKSFPLALCDPNTVKVEEVLSQETYGFVAGGQVSTCIKFSADHKWYYYPDVTKDEVLVMKQFQYERGVEAPYDRIRTVFHSAFKHAEASPTEEPRCSSEYRVPVWLK
ncbi:BCAT2 [Symbiodinium natans]|uniref:BCAT2 protein n=1 Tax=Symbiodinium natans TaxID=878477 RepID=A0A812J5V9_9DINO|nr:BCAT2 [Symbiodinium natans]